MCSLFDKNQDVKEITVYVLSLGLSEENRGKLKEIADRYHRSLEILERGNES